MSGDTAVTANGVSGAAGGIGTIFSLMGNLMAGGVARTQGANLKTAADYEAAQLHQNAGQAQAAAQRQAENERLRTSLLMSRGIAVAASGGGATTDPTVSKVLEDIAAAGEYRSGAAIYQGEEKARMLNMAGNAKTVEGENAAEMGKSRSNAYAMAGLGGFISGASSLYTKYGMGGPKKKAMADAAGDGWIDAGSGTGGLA